MCDTLVALPNATADGSVIFAKNSDREPNEAHHLLLIPAAEHTEGEQVQCTYIQVPQVRHTFAVLLAKPFWIWGAEMGANEHGVVIGNEAVFTKTPYEKNPGLIGMDFLRLALERAATAEEALQVITTLLAAHGQGGSCSFTQPFFYHNSFLIADPLQAWILETAGQQWAARRVIDVGAISNALTIAGEWDLASPDLVNYAVDQGWCKQRDQFNFAKCYSDFLFTRFSDAYNRQSYATEALQACQGMITVSTMMKILRSHRAEHSEWSPASALTGADLCMHAGAGPVRISQATGSMISHVNPDLQTHWVTGTSAPCTSTFKPVWIDAGLPETGSLPDNRFDSDSLWWRHELLHREILRNYPARLATYKEDRDRLETDFIEGSRQFSLEDVSGRKFFSEECFRRAHHNKAQWLERVRTVPERRGWWFYYHLAWERFNRQADFG